MIKKVLLGLIGLSVILAVATVAVFAAAFALFALLAEYVGPAGAAGVIALVATLIVLIGVLVVVLKTRAPHHAPSQGGSDTGLVGKLFALAKEKPLLSASAAAAVAVIAFRNPKLVTALLTGVLAGKASPKN